MNDDVLDFYAGEVPPERLTYEYLIDCIYMGTPPKEIPPEVEAEVTEYLEEKGPKEKSTPGDSADPV